MFLSGNVLHYYSITNYFSNITMFQTNVCNRNKTIWYVWYYDMICLIVWQKIIGKTISLQKIEIKKLQISNTRPALAIPLSSIGYPVRKHMYYKLATFAYKILALSQPFSLLDLHNSPCTKYAQRSSDKHHLNIPLMCTTSIRRSFCFPHPERPSYPLRFPPFSHLFHIQFRT